MENSIFNGYKLPPFLSMFYSAKPRIESSFGKRPDGSEKGYGYFAGMITPDGRVATEKSMDFTAPNGSNILAPRITPNLTPEEIFRVVDTNSNIPNLDRKAMQFAMERIKHGKPTFATPEEEGAFAQKIQAYELGIR